MNVIDSSLWIEYFLDTPLADVIEPIIKNREELIVPAVCFFEVYKRLLVLGVEKEDAETMVKTMDSGLVVNLDASLAISAVEYSVKHKLPLADSIIYATARIYKAELWVRDKHFAGLDGVRLLTCG